MSFKINQLGNNYSSLPIFQGVEPNVLGELLSTAHELKYPKGAVILEQGAPIAHSYIVLEGWCGAGKGNEEGQEAILQIFRRGDFLFDALAEIETDLSQINLQALTSVSLLVLSPQAIRSAGKRSITFMGNVLIASARRCRELREHIEHLTLYTAEQRMGRFLLQLRLNAISEGLDIVLPFDKSSIAAYLGIKPETLSRVLQTYRERGFKVERSHLTMPSQEALCGYCDKVTMRLCPFANTGLCRLGQATVDTPSS